MTVQSPRRDTFPVPAGTSRLSPAVNSRVFSGPHSSPPPSTHTKERKLSSPASKVRASSTRSFWVEK